MDNGPLNTKLKKLKYLANWCTKQGAKLSAIKSLIRLRQVRLHKQGLRLTLVASTEYHYNYKNEPSATNLMRIGTYHSIDLLEENGKWLINREWFTDPFADSLKLSNDQCLDSTNYIISQKPRDFSQLNPRRIEALAYADEYCGAAANDEQGFKYNKKYKNFNYSGGDCANFVSQVLHEGGGFKKKLYLELQKRP